MKTAELQSVTQATTQPRSAEGMVDTLTLVTLEAATRPLASLWVPRLPAEPERA